MMAPSKAALAALAVRRAAKAAPRVEAVLAALPAAVMVIDADGAVRYANLAAEQFFETGATQLCERQLGAVIAAENAVFGLIVQARAGGGAISGYGIDIETSRVRRTGITVEVVPLADGSDDVVLSLAGGSGAMNLNHQHAQRNAARSVTGMVGVLAHEVKNPLSGIRGAAQLLESHARAEDRTLTRLIRDETDRINALIERMEMFSEQQPDRGAVNIHEVLDRVRSLARTGFARHARVLERYDPSLPQVLGNRDQLIQVFLNLLKNAGEAVAAEGGEIVLATSYHHGIWLAQPGVKRRVHLPIRISVEDNGSGVPEDMRAYLFDPFVSTKVGGQGLGLALAAKIVADHDGMIELGHRPRGAAFHVLLPMCADGPGGSEP